MGRHFPGIQPKTTVDDTGITVADCTTEPSLYGDPVSQP